MTQVSDNINWTDRTPKAHAQHPRPNCGYCPTCGRSNKPWGGWTPWYPYTPMPTPLYPIVWCGSNTTTSYPGNVTVSY